MKSMILGALLWSASAFAQNADMVEKHSKFHYSSTQSYYACSYAERQAKHFINEMGGEVVKIRCTGGLPDSPFVSVDMKYRSAVAGAWQQVSLRGNESCDFNTKLINHLVENFEVRDIVSRNSCNFSSGRYQYSFDVLVAE